ncbi:ATP-binding response regulator [Azospirillum brasilense]|nr:hybrid sensor histidine kinase/response regulator [Azospirillum brasilense]
MRSSQGSNDNKDAEVLRHPVGAQEQSREPTLARTPDAQEHALPPTEPRQQDADLRLRLARAEAEARDLRAALERADRHMSAARQDEAHLVAELKTSYKQLQVLADELTRSNADLERRVAERTVELEEANAALRIRKQQLSLAQRSAGAGTWDWNVAANHVTWSPECYDLMGLDRDGDRPLPPHRLLSIVLPEDLPALQRMLEITRDQAEDEFRVEFRISHPHRGVRWIASLGRVVERDPTGRPARVTGLALDLTERKAIEESLRRARDAAESASRAKTSFLAAVSHDLRQPIQAAALYAHVLRGSIGSDPAAVEVLDLLKVSIENLNGMLSGLLDLSRLEAGAVDVAIADVAPGELMTRLCAEFRSMAEEANIDLRFVPTSLAVTTDPHLLERVLRNLLSNAVSHGAPDGAGKTRGRVLLGCRRRAGSVEFQVCDNGPGIPPEARGAIFEEFRQLKNPERNAARGFGLGLSIVARIARLLGLEVSVRSVVGRGSVFAVAVPLARTRVVVRPPAPVALDAAVLAMLKGCTVLLVEDDERIRRSLTMTLTRWGVRVVAVASVEELTTRLPRLRTRPHVLLTDYRLPGGSTGRNVVDLVRRRWDVPGVIITGDTAPERLREARSIGCRLLHKPVEPAELVQALGEVIHRA